MSFLRMLVFGNFAINKKEMGIHTKTKSIFSRNMRDIVVNLVGAEYADITLCHSNYNEIKFTLFTIDGNITLHTSELVHNYANPFEPQIDIGESYSIALPIVSIKVGSQTFDIHTIFGGYDDSSLVNEYDFLQHNFLSWRPQIDYVVPGVKQQLSFVICNSGANSEESYPAITSRKICAKVFFRTQLPREEEIGIFNTDNHLYRIDCSYNTIKALVSDVDDEITAYDIFGAEDIDLENCFAMTPQRFIVKNDSPKYSHFFFQNTLGGFDTITASGEIKASGSGDMLTSSVRGSETEISNSHARSWEVNTGYIATQQEETLWHEFLQSTNRYVIFADGSYRRIIVEEYKAERTKLELGSFTFTYHYAEKEKGYYFHKGELDEFVK